jgi:hypothetical protein
MKRFFTTLCLIVLFLPSLLWGQAQFDPTESLRYEVDNLREQIAIIIQNNHESLIQADEALEQAKKDINQLKSENAYLRQKLRYHTPVATNQQASRELSAAKSRGLRLERDNQYLRNALNQLRAESRRDIRNFVDKLNASEEAKERLVSRVDSFRRVLAMGPETWQRRFREAEERALKLEVENAALWKEAEMSSTNFRKKLESLERYNQALKIKADRLEGRNQELEKQIQVRLKEVQEVNAEQESMLMRTTRYKRTLDSLLEANLALKQSIRYEPLNEKLYRKMDSLKYENTALKRTVDILSTAETVDQKRLHNLEAREAEVRDYMLRTEIRSQLLRDKENDLKMREEELEAKEKKYLGLEEKEKRLKMIEQKLRQMAKGAD